MNHRQQHSQPFHGGHHSPFDIFKRVAHVQHTVSSIGTTAKDMVKHHYRDPEALIAIIEAQHTPVYLLNGPKAALIPIVLGVMGFQPGYLPPMPENKRYRALLRLLAHVEPKPGCRFDHGLFVLTPSMTRVGYLAHQLHHWLACKSGLPGYGELDQQLYKVFWEKHQGVIGAEIETMSVDQIVSLKHAINRDMEALRFIREVMEEILVPANQAGKLSTGTANA
jgi:hypothetical protein